MVMSQSIKIQKTKHRFGGKTIKFIAQEFLQGHLNRGQFNRIWALVALLAFVDVTWLGRNGMSISWPTTVLPLVTTAALLALGLIYTHIRPDERIAFLVNATAALIAYTVVAAVFSYLMVTLRHPLFDKYLVTIDRDLGFDWPTMYGVVKNHPLLHSTLKIIYGSLAVQMFVVLILLNYRRQFARMREFLWLFVVTSLTCIVISGFLPTAGAFIYFNVPTHEPYVDIFMALRDGSMKIIELNHVQGVVQFPSFHLAMAVLLVYAMRGRGLWFSALFLLNTLVVLATPAIGGHHLADLIGGAIITVIVLALMGDPVEIASAVKSANAKKPKALKASARSSRSLGRVHK